MNTAAPILPDLLRSGLSLVFCGTAAGPVSAARGHYYAHPQNKFWKILHNGGFTPHLLAPHEYPALDGLNIGLTDIAKHVWGMDKNLPPQSLGRAACQDLRHRIAQCAPRRLAFTSLTAGRRVLGPHAQLGLQSEKLANTELWILPSPSPAASGHWQPEYWHRLATAYNDAA